MKSKLNTENMAALSGNAFVLDHHLTGSISIYTEREVNGLNALWLDADEVFKLLCWLKNRNGEDHPQWRIE